MIAGAERAKSPSRHVDVQEIWRASNGLVSALTFAAATVTTVHVQTPATTISLAGTLFPCLCSWSSNLLVDSHRDRVFVMLTLVLLTTRLSAEHSLIKPS